MGVFRVFRVFRGLGVFGGVFGGVKLGGKISILVGIRARASKSGLPHIYTQGESRYNIKHNIKHRNSTALALLRGCPYYDDDARPGTFIRIYNLFYLFFHLFILVLFMRLSGHCGHWSTVLRCDYADKKTKKDEKQI